MSATYPRCETCRHWQPSGQQHQRLDRATGAVAVTVAGECHRRPPTTDFRWPKTEAVSWCGEHEAGTGASAAPVKVGKGKAAEKPAEKGELGL